MAVGFKVHFYWYSVGTGSFLYSFFSTVSYHLEPEGWGTKYPYLMNHCYNGKVANALVPEVLKEVHEIRELLQNYSPSQIIWNIEDLSKRPPWGEDISPEITSLANYFVTSEGTDFFKVLISALEQAIKYNFDFEVESL